MAKSKIDRVRKNIDKIIKWKKIGLTDKQVARQLGISVATYYEYQKKYPDILEAIQTGREGYVAELKGHLQRLAEPHKLKTIRKYKRTDSKTGNVTEYVEEIIKEVDPDVKAIEKLLNNLDRENSVEWQTFDLKKEELELKKQIAEDRAF